VVLNRGGVSPLHGPLKALLAARIPDGLLTLGEPLSSVRRSDNHHLCPHILDHDRSHEPPFGPLREEYDLVRNQATEPVCAALAARRIWNC
jgi:hypothetical protein